MTKTILNNINHKDLKVDARPNPRYGDFVNRALVLTTEYADLHREFPILIHKDAETGALAGHAILGLDKDENLFVEDGEWQSQFIPATMARGPFSIGYQRREQDGGESTEIVVMVDEDDPRCGVAYGEEVFLEFGGESPYLEYVKTALQKIEDGMQADKVFFGLLEELDLLEPVSIKVTLSPEKQFGFNGYYTVSQARLKALDGDALQRLNATGMLGLVFHVLSSLGNFQRLIALKNARSSSS